MPVFAKISCNIDTLQENRMFHARDCKTGSLFDKWGHIGPKRRRLLDDSWAGLFRREILPELPVEKLAPAFHDSFGRPTKEMYTTLGALVFQQMFDTTDEETTRQLAFSMEWHFALDLSGESDSAKYISSRTLWTMRSLLAARDRASSRWSSRRRRTGRWSS